MMTIPMENNKVNSSRDLVLRLFNKNLDLESKRRKAAKTRIPLDPSTWQQMRENYETIVLEDHGFSVEHDIEYALWQLHYRRIEELRALFHAALGSASSDASQNGKGSVRSGPDGLAEIRSQFKSFVSEATGFYHDLMLKIRAKYGLPPGYFSEEPVNEMPNSKEADNSTEVKMGLISCHRCLIYLGDLARYKGLYGEGDSKAQDFAAGSSYYMQASSLCPSNGNSQHQLAILAGYSNDELLTIYRYFRSLAVENPFVTARDNLIIAFEKNRLNYTQLPGVGKATTVKTIPSRMPAKGRRKGGARHHVKEVRVETTVVKERNMSDPEAFKAFITRFIRLSGILFTRTSLETFAEVFSTVRNNLLDLFSSGPDEDLTFVRMIAILIYTVHNVNKESENQSHADILKRSVLLHNSLTSTFEFMGCMIERCNQLNDPSSSYLLPGVMVFVEWLACCPVVAVGSELQEEQVSARSIFWNNFISLLNKLLSNRYKFVNEHEGETCFSNMSNYDESETANCLALAEDFELRGFLPLHPAQLILDFSRKHLFGTSQENNTRVHRIIAAGKALTSAIRIGEEGVYFDTRLNKFEIGKETQMSDDYLLTNPMVTNSNGSSVGISVGDEVAMVHVTKPEMDFEDEDEDEVIVFRPPTNEKHMNEASVSLTPSGVIAPFVGAGKDVGEENSSLSNGCEFFQNPSSAIPYAPVTNVPSQNLPPVQPTASRWPAESDPTVDGLSLLNLVENDSSLKTDLEAQFEVSRPAAFSLPYPHFVKNSANRNSSIPIPQATVPSTFDSIISSTAATNALPMNPNSVMPPGFKKNPVSRPIRQSGPPPGFSSVPSKATDDALKAALKIGRLPVPEIDEYSLLNGYPVSSMNQNVGFSNSFHQTGPSFHSMNNINDTMGAASFPFPGKQVPPPQVQSESHTFCDDRHFLGHMNPYGERKQQFQKGNHQLGHPQQNQGRPLWDRRFIV